jgi:hypothetical protein
MFMPMAARIRLRRARRNWDMAYPSINNKNTHRHCLPQHRAAAS